MDLIDFYAKKLKTAYKVQGDKGRYRRKEGAMMALQKCAFGKSGKPKIEPSGDRYNFRKAKKSCTTRFHF